MIEQAFSITEKNNSLLLNLKEGISITLCIDRIAWGVEINSNFLSFINGTGMIHFASRNLRVYINENGFLTIW